MKKQYSIGSSHWPGLSKLIEEAGEVIQVAAKIQGIGDTGDIHWDGSNLRERLADEIADFTAALVFVTEYCNLDEERIIERSIRKLEIFTGWHLDAKKD